MKLVEHDFPWVKLCWLLLIIFSFLMCLKTVSRLSFSITFPGTEVRQISLWFPGSSFLSFLKIGVTYVFLQSLGTSSSYHHQCKIIESGFAMTSTSSLSSRGCIPLGPIDLCVSSLLQNSQTWSSFNKTISSFLQPFSLTSGTWDYWRPERQLSRNSCMHLTYRMHLNVFCLPFHLSQSQKSWGLAV